MLLKLQASKKIKDSLSKLKASSRDDIKKAAMGAWFVIYGSERSGRWSFLDMLNPFQHEYLCETTPTSNIKLNIFHTGT